MAFARHNSRYFICQSSEREYGFFFRRNDAVGSVCHELPEGYRGSSTNVPRRKCAALFERPKGESVLVTKEQGRWSFGVGTETGM